MKICRLTKCFQAIQRLGPTCGLTNLSDSVKELRTKPLDSCTPRMKNLRGIKRVASHYAYYVYFIKSLTLNKIAYLSNGSVITTCGHM